MHSCPRSHVLRLQGEQSISTRTTFASEVHGEVRRALLSQFPYGVFYRVESKRVVVLAVLHTARDPSLWPRPRRSAR